MSAPRMLGHGDYWDDLKVGDAFVTPRRTITETDLVSFCNQAWFTEELFTNAHAREGMAIQGRVVPGALAGPRTGSGPPSRDRAQFHRYLPPQWPLPRAPAVRLGH